ncbi:MAG: o-succinylbenzoate synthase [Chloroflexi bacterium]|nr:o-succinylbenzoate synthase [Chloroflexota bacterium]
MKIDRIELYHIKMRLKAPFRTSFGVEQDRECVLVVVYAEGGVGWGECVASRFPGYSYETVGTAWHVLRDFLIPVAMPAPLAGVEEFVGRVRPVRGHAMAKAGLEMALWDWFARQAGQPLARYLGGERERVSVGVSVGIQPSPERMVETVLAFRARGYPRIKIKIEPGRDLQVVRAVRAAIPGVPLQVDANSAYTLESAGVFRQMDDLDLLLIEQPLAEDDIIDHSRLAPQLRTPLCLDESIHSVDHARGALELGACRIINIKPGRVSGLYEARRIHDFCRAHGAPVWCGGMLETGIGRASNVAIASLPGFTLPGDISASDRYYEQDLTREAFALNPDGTLSVPEGPGLGVTVDPAALARFTLERASFGGG